MFPYEEAHLLLLMAGNFYTDLDWDVEEHKALWDEFYPPKTKKADQVINMTCLGKKVPEDLIEEARRANRDCSQNL